MSEELRLITATATVNGQEVYPTDINIRMDINSYPSITLGYASGREASEGAEYALSQDVSSELASLQRQMFADRNEPDITINIKDSAAGEIDLKGYISAPSYGVSPSKVSRAILCTPDYATLDTFDISFCDAPKDLEQESPTLKGTSIAQLFADWARYTQERWAATRTDNGSLSEAEKTAQLQVNQRVFPFLEQILKDSGNMGWDGIEGLLTNNGLLREDNMSTRMLNILKSQNASGFISNLLIFAAEYQCVYVPDLVTGGKLVNMRELVLGDTTLDIPSDVRNISVTAGERNTQPRKYVAVTSSASVKLNAENQKQGDLYVIYPPAGVSIGGSSLVMLGAPWLPPELATSELSELGTTFEKDQQVISLARMSKDIAMLIDTAKNWKAQSESALYQWAQTAYYWYALRGASATATMFFSPELKLGTRCKVTAPDGSVLFTGFISGLNHSIRLNNKGGTAETLVRFSHITLADFELP